MSRLKALPRASLRARRAAQLWWTILRFGASPLVRRLLRLAEARPAAPVRLRMAMEHLGLTYLKLGQYLAQRFDILPAEVCRELDRLFEGVAPMAAEVVAEVVAGSLGKPIDALYASFSPVPIAAASVGQVHEAWTFDGMKVAVKVQRPGIERVLRADTANLRLVMRLVDAFHLLGRLSATELLDEFTAWTLRELDFVIEGRTADAVGVGAIEFETIPRVRWDLTCPQVLTLEFIEGVSMAQIVSEIDLNGPEAFARNHPEIDLDRVLHNITFSSLNQIFVRGLFHGDPHPGNVIVQEQQHVAYVDFGIFGSLTTFDREILSGQIENLAVGRIEDSLRYYLAQLSETDQSDIQGFRRECRVVLQTWYDVALQPGASLQERHIGKYTAQMIDIARRYGLRFDVSYVLYWRALNAMDSTSLRVSPSFDLVGELRRFFTEIGRSPAERMADAATNPRTLGILADMAGAGVHQARAVLDRAGRGRPIEHYVVGASRATEPSSDARARALVASLCGFSLLILSTRSVVLPAIRGVGAVAGAAMLTGAFVWAVMRS